MKDVAVFEYSLKNGKAYGYRFEIAPEGGIRKWESKRGFKKKSEARKAGLDALALYERKGHIVEPSEMSVMDFLEMWVEQHNAKDITKSGYRKKIKLYIVPKIGKLMLKSVRKADLNKILKELYDEGFAVNTLVAIRGILTKSFDWAVDNKLLFESPAVKLVIPTSTEPKNITRADPHVYIPKDKIEMIFDRFPEGSVNHVALMIGYKCGLRIGEVYGLVWEDIDLESKLLHVNRQVQWAKDENRTIDEKRSANGSSNSGNGYWYFSEPKYKSYRIIEIADDLVELLKREKQYQDLDRARHGASWHTSFADRSLTFGGVVPNVDQKANRLYLAKPEKRRAANTEAERYRSDGKTEVHFVCIRENGEYVSSRTMQHTSSIIHHQLGYPEFDFHSLRHTHATMLMENGAPPVYIQKRLGHKKIDVTLNIYANHLTDTVKSQGVAVLNNIY